MGSYRYDSSGNGPEILRLQNAAVEIVIVPAAGGKIVEIVDRRSGRNWLWRNPHIPLTGARRDADFDSEQDSGGWDEILLSIAPGRIKGASNSFLEVPDHGDLIGSEWQVANLAERSDGSVVCDMVVHGRAAPYEFRRRITLHREQALIDFDYQLINAGTERLPAFWCAHPLLAIDEDAHIDIDGQESIRFGDASAASKVFVATPANGEASVSINGGSERLLFRVERRELPWFGLWMNNRGWSGCGSRPYRNLGVEPATSPHDCVNEAIANDSVPWLEGGAERRWSLQLELQS